MRREAPLLLIACSGMLLSCDKPPASAGLPAVLTERGFGDPVKPVAIVVAGTPFEGAGFRITLKGTDRMAPGNTKWVYNNPRPVWECFAGTKTQRFYRGMYSGSMASLVIGYEPSSGSNQVTLQPHPGEATVQGQPEGGEWSFDATAVLRLVKLLNQTAPAELGVPILMGHEGKHVGGDRSTGLAASIARGAAGWEGLQKTFKTRYPHLEGKPLDAPKEFGLVIAAWLPPRDSRDMLTYRNARLAGTALKWELQLHERKDEREPGFRPAVVGFFSPPSPVQTVEIWLDGKLALVVERVLLDPRESTGR